MILPVLSLSLGACAETQFLISSTKRLQGSLDGPSSTTYKVGTPYQIQGTWYYPEENWEYDETGIASWYGPKFHGKDTANGETYDMNELTAAHRTLPMPSFVRVTNLENGRALVLRVNDRGPFAKGRIIDVSRRGAQLLAFERQGTARVRVQILAEQSLAEKAAILGQEQVAAEGSPINVAKLPKAEVSASTLPPPPGTETAPESAVTQAAGASQAPVQAQSQVQSQPITSPTPPSPSSFSRMPKEEVTEVAVAPTQIFVQAGAFQDHQNAVKTQLRISQYVPAEISHVLVNKKDFYRVRIGPIGSVEEADRALETVQQIGYPGAQIIVTGNGGS